MHARPCRGWLSLYHARNLWPYLGRRQHRVLTIAQTSTTCTRLITLPSSLAKDGLVRTPVFKSKSPAVLLPARNISSTTHPPGLPPPPTKLLDASPFFGDENFTIITQTQYESTHKFKPQPPISFLDKDGHPTLLWVMLQKEFSRPDWERPCPLKAVDRRVFLRVRIEDAGCKGTVDRQIYTRTTAHVQYTHAKLGQVVAHTIRKFGRMKDFYKKTGRTFEDLAIYELQNVAKASWQPVLGMVTL